MSDSNVTKRALAAALRELMEKEPFDKIQVAQICQRCDMNRMDEWRKDARRDVVITDIDTLVPEDHLLRKIEKVMDYDRLYERLDPYYNHEVGRPGTDPVVLIKMVLIQHLFGMPSLRQTYQRMRYTQHRGLARVTTWVRLKFAAMNLKKIAVWSWGKPCFPHVFVIFCLYTKTGRSRSLKTARSLTSCGGSQMTAAAI